MTFEESTTALPHPSLQQQQMVRETLQSILDSAEFRKSNRYPALLKYIVLNTLEGNLDVLKERVVGTEVFQRPPGYDPGVDAIVRTTAGEVRRRMAIYFGEHPDSPVRIDLPVGRYAAEFHFRSKVSDGAVAESAEAEIVTGDHPALNIVAPGVKTTPLSTPFHGALCASCDRTAADYRGSGAEQLAS